MNKTLFETRFAGVPKADAINGAGGIAYQMSDKHALAQYVSTGTFNATYYATEQDHLATILDLCSKVPTDFIAKAAVYSRNRAYMKDMPAFLCAYLAAHDLTMLKKVFPLVITNGKMLRNFVQVIRSGAVGRKSFGTAIKRLIQDWLNARNGRNLFMDSVGNDPSIVDVIKMVHPKAKDDSRNALYRYLIGKECDLSLLPKDVQAFEAYKTDRSNVVPDVDFRMLTALDLGPAEWMAIAKTCSWQTLRMNLNTFARHGVFNDPAMVVSVAERLRDETAIRNAKAFPYQLLTAYNNTADVPIQIQSALQDAMEIAISNVPRLDNSVYVFPDVSGSMRYPITGYRKGSSSATRCVDVAALIAAAFLRTNERTVVIPFEADVVNVRLNPRDSVMTNAQRLVAVGGGGTNCAAPLALLNRENAGADLIVYVSDNESWIDSQSNYYGGRTATAEHWQKFKRRNPHAKMVCIDLTPNTTTQVVNRQDVLNIGGWSDVCFEVIADFVRGGDGNRFVAEIENIVLDGATEAK